MSGYSLGIDIGGTVVKAVCVTPDGRELSRHSFPTQDEASDAWVARIRSSIESVEREHGRPAQWLGLSAPGIAAPDGKTIWWMMGRMEAVMGLNWTEKLGRQAPVPVLNDAQAALLGEIWKGSAAGAKNAVLLTLGTGIGGAIVCDGRLLRGAIGRAGHLGHLSLDPDGEIDIVNTPGSVEYFFGNYRISERTGGQFTSTHDLVKAYEAGDAEARRLWLQSVKSLAAAIVSIINAVDPEVVILGGGIARAGESLMRPLREYLDKFEWRPHGHRVRFVQATLGEFAGAYGCAYNAMQEGGR
jgi:glucokinase